MPKKADPKPKVKKPKKDQKLTNRSNRSPTPSKFSPKGYTLVEMQDAKDNFPETLKSTMNLVTMACKKANISRTTYYQWRLDDEVFAKDCDEVPELIGDMVESEAYKKIAKGDGEMIRFYLKTKLRGRGFVTTTEHTGLNGGAIAFSNKDEDLNKLRRFNEEQLRKYIELKSILDDPITPAS